ncbi:phosphotransferase [Parvibaculum sp.]|uniref:phosphotransferase n=1 Tax=Parvibaculum sp. TaxID=2024848 RepID=UPI001D21462B|nr:phosphotransferase [Parvibaculum sp.]MBX3490002.1 hypothetical protein [Parvibaculum sp.]MCW5726010.1 hypothetical protein [Parvibaculum sp.]
MQRGKRIEMPDVTGASRPGGGAGDPEFATGWLNRIVDLAGPLEEAPAGAPDDASTYFVLHKPGGFIWVPADAERWLPHIRAFGLIAGDPAQAVRRMRDEARRPHGERQAMRVRLPAGATIRFNGRTFEDTALLARTASLKVVGAVIDRESGAGRAVLKGAGLPRIARNLGHEYAALQGVAGRGIAPRPFGAGGTFANGEGPVTTAQSWCAGRLVAGRPVADLAFLRAVEATLLRLVEPEAEVTLRGLAEERAAEIAAYPRLEHAEKQALLRLLTRVRDRTPVAASRLHGDMRPLNMLHVPGGTTLRLLDWEFSRTRSLGLLDFLRFALDRHYAAGTAASLEALIDAPARRLVDFMRASQLPGAQLPFGELLPLHFVIHYADRIGSFGRTSPRMMTLQRILAGEMRAAA